MPRKKIAALMLLSILMLSSAVFSPEVLAEDTDRIYYGTDPTAFETKIYTRDRNYYETPVLYPGDSLVFQTDSQPINGLRYMGYSSIGPLWDELDPENTVFEIHEDVGGNQKYL